MGILRGAARTLGLLILGALQVAWAGVPLSLPPGERQSDWQTAAEMAGFTLGPPVTGGAAGVVLVGGTSSWEIRVREPGGVERRVPVPAPHDAREREDLLWVAASLAAPLRAAALKVPSQGGAPTAPPPSPEPPPAPAPAPASPPRAAPAAKKPPAAPRVPTPTPPPEAALTPAGAAAERDPWAVPVASVTPPSEQPSPPPISAAPSPVTPPAEATLPASPAPGARLRPMISARLGLGAGAALSSVTPLDALSGRGGLRAGVALRDTLETGLNLSLQSSSAIEELSAGERWGRSQIGVDLGVRLGATGEIAPRLELSAARYRFATEGEGRLGALTVPSLGLHVEARRALGTTWTVLGDLGLEQDLREVLISKTGSDTVYSLPNTHLTVSIGIGWEP